MSVLSIEVEGFILKCLSIKPKGEICNMSRNESFNYCLVLFMSSIKDQESRLLEVYKINYTIYFLNFLTHKLNVYRCKNRYWDSYK